MGCGKQCSRKMQWPVFPNLQEMFHPLPSLSLFFFLLHFTAIFFDFLVKYYVSSLCYHGLHTTHQILSQICSCLTTVKQNVRQQPYLNIYLQFVARSSACCPQCVVLDNKAFRHSRWCSVKGKKGVRSSDSAIFTFYKVKFSLYFSRHFIVFSHFSTALISFILWLHFPPRWLDNIKKIQYCLSFDPLVTHLKKLQEEQQMSC